MFESLTKTIKKFTKSFSGSEVFSSLAIMPFNKYRKNYTAKDYLNVYDISLYVNKAINKRAEKVGEVQFELKRGDEVVENHPVLELLAKPNKAFTSFDFWGLYQKYMDIFGEVYMVKEGEPVMGGKTRNTAIHILRSDLVKPFFDKNTGELTKIEYNTSEGTRTYEAEEVLYIHNPNPVSPLRGESLLNAGIRQIETGTQIDEYHSKILENGGRPEGVFNFKQENLTGKQLSELKQSFQDQYGNAKKAGLPLFLGGNATYERLGLDPAELAYLETKKINMQDVVRITGVPDAILGVTSDQTFANADASIRVFLRETIKPLITKLVTKLNEDLIEEGLELTFVDPTPEDREETRKDLETANTINAMTINEKRKALGLQPLPNGDVILAPMNLMPALQEKEETPPQEKQKSHHPLRDKNTRRVYHALQIKRLERRQQVFKRAINTYFDGQKERIIERLTERKQFKVKNLLSEIFNTTLEIRLAKETALPVLEELLKEAGETSKEISGSDFDFIMTSTTNSWLDNKTEIFAKQINETTFKNLNKEFTESLAQNETRKELVDRIENVYEGKITKARAETIARTEVHGVTQYGTLEGYKQAGMSIKIWTWSPGEQGGVRDSHKSMDGEEKPLGTAFSNGLDMPGVGGSASETINCMCFI